MRGTMWRQSTPVPTPSSDVVERFKQYVAEYEDAPNWGGPTRYPDPPEIADFKAVLVAIERLSAERLQLREALKALRGHHIIAGCRPISPTGELRDLFNNADAALSNTAEDTP